MRIRSLMIGCRDKRSPPDPSPQQPPRKRRLFCFPPTTHPHSRLRQSEYFRPPLIDAAKAGDTGAFNDAHERWYSNGDDIADFLSAANRKQWPRNEMRMMMKSHLDLTLEEAAARLNGDYAADTAVYEKVHADILHMADMLSDGIIHQFSRAFR